VAIHPNEGLSGGGFVRRRKPIGDAALQAPSQEEPRVFGIDVWESAVMNHVVVVGESGENLAFT
jgi:hypothetical protein